MVSTIKEAKILYIFKTPNQRFLTSKFKINWNKQKIREMTQLLILLTEKPKTPKNKNLVKKFWAKILHL